MTPGNVPHTWEDSSASITIPSAPTGVVHTGSPCCQASTTLPLRPAPKRRGARHALYVCMTFKLGAWPLMWKPDACSTVVTFCGAAHHQLMPLQPSASDCSAAPKYAESRAVAASLEAIVAPTPPGGCCWPHAELHKKGWLPHQVKQLPCSAGNNHVQLPPRGGCGASSRLPLASPRCCKGALLFRLCHAAAGFAAVHASAMCNLHHNEPASPDSLRCYRGRGLPSSPGHAAAGQRR